MSGEIAQILYDLASEIEKTYAELGPSNSLPKVSSDSRLEIHTDSFAGHDPVLTGGEHSPSVHRLHSDLVAIAQDLRESANAALQSRPTLFWIEGLLSRARALGPAEFAELVARAEQRIARHYP